VYNAKRKMKRTVTVKIFATSVFLATAPIMASAAQGLVPCGGSTGVDCKLCHLFEMIGRIVDMVVWKVVPSIAIIMLIVAGIRFFTALGNPSELEKIKKMFFGIFAGILIVVLAWGITVALYKILGAGTPTGWWNIPGCP